MGVLRVRTPWKRQPQYPVGIDWGNPLTKGLRALFSGIDPSLEIVNSVRFIQNGAPAKIVGVNGCALSANANGLSYDGFYAPETTSGSRSDKLYDIVAPPITLFIVGNSSSTNDGCGIGRSNGSGNISWGVGFWQGSAQGAWGKVRTTSGTAAIPAPPSNIDTRNGYHTAVLVVDSSNATVYTDGVPLQSAATPSGNFYYQYGDKYNCFSIGGGYTFAGGNFALSGMVADAWVASQVRSFHANPWQVFAP